MDSQEHRDMDQDPASFQMPADNPDAIGVAGQDDGFDRQATEAIAAVTKSRQPSRRGPDMIQKVIEDSIDMLFEHLRQSVQEKPNNRLTFAEIKAEVAVFKAQPSDALTAFCRDTWAQCIQAVESERWEKDRTRPLERLVMNNFAHLLPPVGDVPVQGKHISRRIVGPFLSALRQLLGPESFDQYEAGCNRMVDRLQKRHGQAFTWDMVLDEPTGQTVVNDVLVYISRHFLNMRKRRRWMVDLITSTLPAATADTDGDWRFGDREFHMLMDALYFGLRTALDSDHGRQSLGKRYNDSNVATVYSMLQALDRDYMETMREDGGA
jgi:hypothetical protein